MVLQTNQIYDGVTRVYEMCHQGVARGTDGGKLSDVNARTMSRRQNGLVGKLKMAVCDLVSTRTF